MAEAGYCSECGKNVILTPEGECPSGHGAECISDVLTKTDGETTSAAAEGAPQAESAPQVESEAVVPAEAEGTPQVEAPSAPTTEPEAGAAAGPREFFDEEQPAPASPPAPPLPPQRSHSGFIVFVGAAILILIVLVAALLFAPGLLKNNATKSATGSVASPEKAKVEAAQAFIRALFAADALAMKPYLVDSAQNAITAADWNTVASAIPTVPVRFAAPTWSSATTAVSTFSAQDSNGTEATGTLEIGSGLTTTTPNALEIALSAAGSTETVVAVMTESGGTWRVISITDSTGASTLYDATFVKTMLADAQAAATQ
jgi:hypothetical protein